MFKTKLAVGALALFTLFSGTMPAFAADASLTVNSTARQTTVTTATSVISPAEADALQFMREEEKLAHDVYVTLYNQWGSRVFNNIAASEQKHMDAIATLLSRYNLSDPAAGKPLGEFTNPDLQALYNHLIAQGSTSVVEALKVGAAIEEIDILDLEEHMAETANADILRVYGNLLAGSENHLRSFIANLENLTGTPYVPQYLDRTAFDAIVTSTGGAQNLYLSAVMR